ncbi:hypothetical protein ACFL1L_05505 [Thermoplasmatota archaeon]
MICEMCGEEKENLNADGICLDCASAMMQKDGIEDKIDDLFLKKGLLVDLFKNIYEMFTIKNITFTAYPSEICKGDEYYWEFDWGDGSNIILGPYNECIEINVSHIWTNKGIYSIGIRYREDDIWSNWCNLNISVYKFKIFTNIQNRNFFMFNRLLILQ